MYNPVGKNCVYQVGVCEVQISIAVEFTFYLIPSFVPIEEFLPQMLRCCANMRKDSEEADMSSCILNLKLAKN